MKSLEELYNYYFCSRGAGHTELMKKGSENYDKKFILVVGSSARPYIKNENLNATIFTLNDIASYKLRGLKYPIIFDNSAMMDLFIEIADEKKYLKDENMLLNSKIELLNTINSVLRDIVEIDTNRKNKKTWLKRLSNWIQRVVNDNNL